MRRRTAKKMMKHMSSKMAEESLRITDKSSQKILRKIVMSQVRRWSAEIVIRKLLTINVCHLKSSFKTTMMSMIAI